MKRFIAFFIAAVLVLASVWVFEAQGEEKASASCLSDDEVKTILTERKGYTWFYAPEDASNIKLAIESGHCVSREGDILRYAEPLTGEDVRVFWRGAREDGHWYRIKRAGIGKTKGAFLEAPSRWFDIYLDPKHTLTLIQYVPSIKWKGVSVSYRILLWEHEPEATKSTWQFKAWVDFYDPYPIWHGNGEIDIQGYLYSRNIFPREEDSKHFAFRYAPALGDFLIALEKLREQHVGP